MDYSGAILLDVKIINMKIQIREYRDSDYAVCRSLWGEMAQHHADIYQAPSIAGNDPGRGFDEYMGRVDRCCTYVAERGVKVVGLAGLLTTHEMSEGGEIEPVVVTAALRSRGIGTKLVEHVVDEARKRGVRFLRVRPVARNIRAISLYVRLGFDIIGHIDLFQDLLPESDRKWKSGLVIHGEKLKY
jgi:GNAT superfamily N-acetyltransferase